MGVKMNREATWRPTGGGRSRIAAWLVAVALLLGGAGLGLADGALPQTAAPESEPIADHFERGRLYMEQGRYAEAVLEFEQVFTFENLPPDLRQQAEIYERAARDYEAGKRLSAFGYLETGGGYYRENETRSTKAAGGDPVRDWFWKARAGGGLSYVFSDDFSVDATLDYRFRYYDDTDRRDDEDLRWNAAVFRSLANGSQAVGVRGRASYRGPDGDRQDYGVFARQGFNLDADNRIEIEAEVRTREYPRGRERDRSRDIAQFWLRWSRSLFDGRAGLTLTALGGREWSNQGNRDRDQDFYGATFDFSMDLNDELGFFLFGLYEHNAFDEERAVLDDNLDTLALYSRSDDLYELEAGLTWEFAPSWSLRPQVLWLRDESSSLWGNYSSTELWMMLRKSF
jgi:hypothetical protein